MLSDHIQQLIENKLRKERQTTSSTELNAGLEPTPIFQFLLTKLQEHSLLHHICIDTQPIVRPFYNQCEKELRDMLQYVQRLGLVNAYHLLDIDLLAEAAGKHYCWKTEHNIKAEE